MEQCYRIPAIEEFVEDFKFQYLDINDYRFGFIDFSSDRGFEEISKCHSENWIDCICDWKYPNGRLFTEESEGIKITYGGETRNFFSRFRDDSIKQLINKGRIRVKI